MTYYDRISSGYGELYRDEQLRKARLLLENLEIRQGDRVLDVGCGNGMYWDIIPSKDVKGIDPSGDLIASSPHKGSMTVACAESLPFPDHSFDVVVSLSAIHNFGNIRKALSEMRRVCDGSIAITVLKKSRRSSYISSCIERMFIVKRRIDEGKDLIYILE